MFIIASYRTRREFSGYFSFNRIHGVSYWSGVAWGAKGIAKRFNTIEEAESERLNYRHDSQWEYPAGEIIDENDSI